MTNCLMDIRNMEKSLVTDEHIQNEKFNRSGNDLGNHDLVNKRNEMQDIISNEFKEQLQVIKQDILGQINNHMNNMVSDIIQRVDKMMSKESKDLADSETYCNRIKPTRADVLPPKQFLRRNSLLTDLYEIKHIRTIYNVIVSSLIILLIRTAAYDIQRTGYPNLAIGTIQRAFGKFPVVIYVWSLMKFSTLAVYVAFSFWATHRLDYSPKSFMRKLWDYAWLAAIILYQITFIVLSTRAVINEHLPVASSLIILFEQLRLVMKTHAFVRSVAPRFLSYKPHTDEPEPKPPGFSKYLYFMMAPTLIYQDDYPRTREIRWKTVLSNFAEVLTIISFVSILYERMIQPSFEDFGKQPIEFATVLLPIFESIIPGVLLFFCGFYLLLHCWFNLFAEILRFADRMFYKDWWNSTCYSAFYRTWNIVVHDWLYTFIYKDMYEIVAPRNKTLALCTVFAISAVFHEYLFCVTFRFFLPIMLLQFGGLGLLMVFVMKSAGNVFVWLSLSIGSGMMTSLYSMEYFARINCAPVRDDFLDFVIPRILTCTPNSAV